MNLQTVILIYQDSDEYELYRILQHLKISLCPLVNISTTLSQLSYESHNQVATKQGRSRHAIYQPSYDIVTIIATRLLQDSSDLVMRFANTVTISLPQSQLGCCVVTVTLLRDFVNFIIIQLQFVDNIIIKVIILIYKFAHFY